MKQFIEIGEFVSVHGVAGELKLYPWADSAEALAHLKQIYFGEEGQRPTPAKARVHKNMLLVKLAGVDTVEAARLYMNQTAYAARRDLPLAQGRFFVQDIVGCRAEDETNGQIYGVIEEVINNGTGASDIYKIVNEAGEVFYFPAAPEFLGEMNPEAGFIKLRPIEGMFTNET